MWVMVGARTVHTAEALLTSFFQHWREQEEGVPTCSDRREDPWSHSRGVDWVCSAREAERETYSFPIRKRKNRTPAGVSSQPGRQTPGRFRRLVPKRISATQ